MTGILQDTAVQQCIDDCLKCYRMCWSMALTHCLPRGGAHAEPAHVSLMLDCAQMCETTARFMLSASTLHTELCALCAKVCAACAQSCRGLEGMEDCEAACRACEASCRAVAGVEGPGAHADDAMPATGVRGGPPRQGIMG
ncbi:MAG TPA: four-helix bundle copper-binding protein [Burkholderiaceae bacterium]|nr:four-helix bundle copper-binding protein [Burkholderiaceae bacterium]